MFCRGIALNKMVDAPASSSRNAVWQAVIRQEPNLLLQTLLELAASRSLGEKHRPIAPGCETLID